MIYVVAAMPAIATVTVATFSGWGLKICKLQTQKPTPRGGADFTVMSRHVGAYRHSVLFAGRNHHPVQLPIYLLTLERQIVSRINAHGRIDYGPSDSICVRPDTQLDPEPRNSGRESSLAGRVVAVWGQEDPLPQIIIIIFKPTSTKPQAGKLG